MRPTRNIRRTRFRARTRWHLRLFVPLFPLAQRGFRRMKLLEDESPNFSSTFSPSREGCGSADLLGAGAPSDGFHSGFSILSGIVILGLGVCPAVLTL